MNQRRNLLLPFAWTVKNRFFPGGKVSPRTAGLAFFALAVLVALYLAAAKVTGYFFRQNELGVILCLKIFQMAWILLFAMQVFSCLVATVSSFFLSRDNEIVFAAPVSPAELFSMRYTTMTIYSSWMLVVFSLPVFAAFGQAFSAPALYWPLMLATVVATVTSATAIASVLAVFLVHFFPARRLKDIVMYLSLLFAAFIYFMLRLLRPEELVNPDQFGHFMEYLSSISQPAAPWLPAGWAANLLSLYLLDSEIDWLLLALMLLTPVALYLLAEAAMGRWFTLAHTKSQESFGGHLHYRPSRHVSRWRWLAGKEARGFWRDSAEWSQLFMIAALVVVYLYNFKMLPVERSPLEREYTTNLLSFLNIGLAGFIAVSLSARFIYPSVSAEGESFVLVRAAPISMQSYLRAKYFFYAVPLSLLTLVLTVFSDRLLQTSGPMSYISAFSAQCISWTVAAIAIGLGARYADFKAESKTAVLGGYGAILFLFLAAAYEFVVIASSAVPVYRFVRKWTHGDSPSGYDFLLLFSWALATLVLSFVLGRYFFRKGAAVLEGSGDQE